MNGMRMGVALGCAVLLLSAALEADAATARVRCRVRLAPARVQISVDGRDLAPGSYTATVTSAAGSVTSAAQAAVGDQAEFDFDSDADNIAAGATRISATFAGVGEMVIGMVDGPTPASGSAQCVAK